MIANALRTACFAGVLSVLGGCASSQSATDRAEQRPITAVDYFPVASGNSWAYLIEKKQGGKNETLLATSLVTKVENDKFELKVGSELSVYEIRSDGIYKTQSQYYSLKDPIAKGARWSIMGDRGEVRVQDVGITDTVPAGKFENCILIAEEIFNSERVEWTYAPNVGPIRMRVFLLGRGKETLLIDGSLKSYRLASWD